MAFSHSLQIYIIILMQIIFIIEIYIDLNGLKKMNDVHGHESGDGLICRAASAIMAVFPETGFRVGGDEFVIAKAEISEEQFLRKMDQLHEEMESRQIILCMKQRENII